jgi:hypothetical protein
MDVLLHLAVGIGLSAAAGFRILIPFLVMGIAANTGHLTLSPDMAWMGSQEAIAAFAVAAVLEVLVYFVPVIDNAMDVIEVPAAAIAGTILTASMTGDMSPFLRWTLAAIAGGTIAGGTSALTGFTRLVSTAAAGPVGNVAVSSTELASSTVLSILAIALPVLALLLLVVLMLLAYRRWRRRKRRLSRPE